MMMMMMIIMMFVLGNGDEVCTDTDRMTISLGFH